MTIYALSSGPGISGIAVIRVSGTNTANVIKKHLDIPLTQEEERIERAFKRGEYDKTKK